MHRDGIPRCLEPIEISSAGGRFVVQAEDRRTIFVEATAMRKVAGFTEHWSLENDASHLEQIFADQQCRSEFAHAARRRLAETQDVQGMITLTSSDVRCLRERESAALDRAFARALSRNSNSVKAPSAPWTARSPVGTFWFLAVLI